MGPPRISYAAPFTRSVVSSNILAQDPFVLADVGVSGGFEQHWRLFEPHLHGFGFDPLVKECERLRRGEKNRDIRYFDCFLGSEKYATLLPVEVAIDPVKGWSNQPFERTSAARAQKLQPVSYEQWLNNDPEVIYSTKRTSLDTFFIDYPGETVDFVKVDTDGHDYEVLTGAEKVIKERAVLGIFVECQFHGITHPHSNLFSNIDRFMRERGFSLFDMEIYRYTRAVLPGHFVYGIAAQTHEGQVLAADALYLRDIAAPGYGMAFPISLSSTKLLKLACLFEIYGMPDCSAELLIARRDALASYVNVQSALDLLAREIEPDSNGFEQYNVRFHNSPESFYPITALEFIRKYAPRRLKGVLSRAKRGLIDYLIRRT
jgi:FkbM family methyltransferase